MRRQAGLAFLFAGALVLASCGNGDTSTVASKGETGPGAPPPCRNPLPPKEMPLPTDVDLNLTGTVPNDAGVSSSERAAVQAVLKTEPELAAFIERSQGDLTTVAPWQGQDGKQLGYAAGYRFASPADLPTYLGTIIRGEVPKVEENPVPVAVDERGLPKLEPVKDPASFEKKPAMTMFVSQVGGVDSVHYILPSYMTADSCGNGGQAG